MPFFRCWCVANAIYIRAWTPSSASSRTTNCVSDSELRVLATSRWASALIKPAAQDDLTRGDPHNERRGLLPGERHVLDPRGSSAA